MRRKFTICVGALGLLATSCTSGVDESERLSDPASSTSEPIAVESTVPSSSGGSEIAGFRVHADAITRSLLVLQPELVTELGAGDVIGFDADYLLNDLSAQGQAALATAATKGLATLAVIEPESAADELSSKILRWYLDDVVAMAGFVDYENPVSFITGAHASFGEYMADVHPLRSEQNAEDYVDRLIAFGSQVADLIDRLESAEAAGIVPAQRSLDIARFQIGAAIGNGDVAAHSLVADFRARVAALPGEKRQWAAGVGGRAEASVDGLIIPALEDLDDAVRRIDGRSDQFPGVGNVDGGDEYYSAVLRHHLSIDLTPEEVHELGLEHVARLTYELTVILDTLGYEASADFGRAMRRAASDAGDLPTTNQTERAAVLERTLTTVERATEVFGAMFTVRPETALDVVRPRPGREGGSGAYYRPPPIDGSRAGAYYLSLGGSEFGVLAMDTTTYHEGIPGHHFQMSVQRALDDLPLHQRVFDFAGYAEGWALYAERLAFEAGLYDTDPLGNVGRLQMELLRASRMVVDTGIHWDGWSRNEAVAYMTDLGFDNGRASSEVDRYVVWPGQAPAYMVGMLEILRLRDEAAAELGEDFDLVGFHDALLSQGSVPVALLKDVVDTWVSAEIAKSD